MKSPRWLPAGGRIALAVLCGMALPQLVVAQDLQPVPPLTARVTDLTGTLTDEQRAALEAKLAAFEREKGAQVAVLVVPTTRPEDIAQYSIRVVDAWKLGRARPDDGVLLLVAKDDRQLRIEVGYGLEGALPDAIASRIIRETITPRFRQGDFYGGIDAGVDRHSVSSGESRCRPRCARRRTAPNAAGLPPLLFRRFVFSGLLRAIFGRDSPAAGRRRGWRNHSVLATLGMSIVAGIGAWLLSLFLSLGAAAWSSGPRHGGWGGGWGGAVSRRRFGRRRIQRWWRRFRRRRRLGRW